MTKKTASRYREDGIFERAVRPTPKPRTKAQKSFDFYDARREALDDELFMESVMKPNVWGGGYHGAAFQLVRERRDSVTDPYQIDYLLKDVTGTPFEMGMGMHPGRRDLGTVADWDRDLRADFERIWADGVRTIVCLVEEHEFSTLRIRDYISDAEDFGFEVIWFPIPDVSVPVSRRQVHKVAYEMWQRLHAGRVLLHCRGGKGRTGTLACCLLELLGWSFDDALKTVRSVRAGAVETQSQELWCKAFQEYANACRR